MASVAKELTTTSFVGNPWSRQPEESDRSFLAFTIYRDLGESRSLAKADEDYRSQRGLPVKPRKSLPTAQIEEWSATFRWVERVAAYDDHLDAEELRAHRRAIVRSASRHARQSAEASTVLFYPLQVIAERIEDILAGRHANDLKDMGTEDLIRLGRHTAAILTELHKAEREAYRSTDSTVAKTGSVKLQGAMLRRLMDDKGLMGAMEELAFQMTISEGDSPAPSPEPILKPVTDVTGHLPPAQDNEKDPPDSSV